MNTKFKLKLIGIIALAAIFGFTLIGCPTDDDGGGGGKGTRADIAYTIEQVGGANPTNGGNGADSTAIKFTFTDSIGSLGLTADDITVGGKADKAADATFDGSGKIWTLAITVNGSGTAIVSIDKDGIEKTQRTVTVYKAGEAAPITYGLTTTSSGPVTTGIVFTFSEAVSDLDADDITITDDTGAVTTGSLTGSGTTWTLGITVVTAGNVKVSINKNGIDDGEQSVAVSKAPDIDYTATQVGGASNTATSTGIVFSFDGNINDLTADDIEVTGAATKAADATLTGSGTGRTLPITVNAAGVAAVKINKDGIVAEQKSVIVHKVGEPTPAVYQINWNLDGGTENPDASYPTLIEQDGVLARPSPDPTKANHVFAYWEVSSQGYDFASPVTEDLTLKAKWWDEFDAGFEANPNPLTADVWANGRIASGEVWYSFEVTSGETYYVWLNAGNNGNSTKTANNPGVVAYTSDGVELSWDEDGGWESPYEITATSTGTVRVRVQGGNGTFAIVYSENNTPRPSDTTPGTEDSPIPLFDNVWENGEDNGYYSFEVTSNTTYYVWLNKQGAGDGTKTMDASYEASYSDGTSIFTTPTTTPQTFTAASTGTVKVKVWSPSFGEPSASNATGTFAVAYTTRNIRPVWSGDVARTLTTVAANGNNLSQLTTQLTLTFNQAIAGFSAADIFLSGVPGVTKGTLSGSGPTYTLTISNVTSSGTLSVTVAKTGFNISNSTRDVNIYRNSIILTAVATNGTAIMTSTQLILNLNQAIPGFTADDITLSGMPGVTKGNIGGSGTQCTLYISGASTGVLTVSVAKEGYTINGSPKTVAIYAAAGNVDNPISLVEGAWMDGRIDSIIEPIYYSFNVTSGQTYYVWCNRAASSSDSDGGDGNKSANVRVSASYSDGTSIFSDVVYAWNTPQTFNATSTGTVRVWVTKQVTSPNNSYAVAYATTDTRPESTRVLLNYFLANGNVATTTTQLTLNFDKAIDGLTADDIFLSRDGVIKGTLTGTGPSYTLPISGLTYGGSLGVSVSKAGYSILGSPGEVTVSYYTTNPTFESVTADGSDSQTTTQITLTFSSSIYNLAAANINLSGVEGVTKGSFFLSNTGPTYTLPISGFTSNGTLTVEVVNTGATTVTPSSLTVPIYYVPPTPVTFSSVTAVANATGSATAALNLTFSEAIDGLTANDITLSGVTDVVKGTLTGAGPSYTLPISGFTAGGALSVAVAKSGYDVSDSSKTVTIVAPVSIAAIAGVGTPAANGNAGTAVTETAQYTGTIAWSPALVNGKFAANTAYTATITLTAKTDFTFNGLANDFFTVAGAPIVNSGSNTGGTIKVTATFPSTAR